MPNRKWKMAKIYCIKEVLGDHVYSKVCELTCQNVDKITGMLLECDKQTILNMLENKDVLKSYVKRASESLPALSFDEDKSEVEDELGDELYNKVLNKTNNELMAAQITGMLLDTGSNNIDQLLQSPQLVQAAVEKAERVLQDTQSQDSLEQDQLADELYCKVEDRYPELAPQITGMLLELDSERLKYLLQCDELLNNYIDQASTVLTNYKSSCDTPISN